jgi:hypothetical protein
MSEALSLSRRQFLAGLGGCVATTAAPAHAITETTDRVPARGRRGDISREGRRTIAAVDCRFAQQRAPSSNTVHAVENLGLDPTGKTTINGQFANAIEDLPPGTRVVFPGDGTFRATEQLVVRPSRIDLIGNGCTFKLDSDLERRILNIDKFPSGSLLTGFNITATGETATGLRVGTDGTVKVKNVNIKGYMLSDQSNPNHVSATFTPVAYTSSATVRATNITSIGGGAAGTHDQQEKPESAIVNQIATPMGVWIGRSTKGTIQLVKCRIRGWSNGLYGGRTNGQVGVYGGMWYNNFNAQLRLGGGSVIDGVTLVLDDREWSKEQNPGPFSLGEKQGVYAIRVDSKHGNQSDPLRVRNTEIIGKSMQEGASLVDFEPISAPGLFENCKFTNHLDRPVILGESLSGGPPQYIAVKYCLFDGSSPKPVLVAHDRPQSRIAHSCIAIPNAGPEDIRGAEIGKGVNFGQCKGTGLRAPKKVGSAGNISSLPAPTYNGSGVGMSAVSGPSKEEVRKNYQKWAMGAVSSIAAAGVGIAMFLLGGLLVIIKLMKD